MRSLTGLMINGFTDLPVNLSDDGIYYLKDLTTNLSPDQAKRLNTKLNTQKRSVYFELEIFALFKKMGFNAEFIEVSKEKTPDIMVSSLDKQFSCIVECTVLTEHFKDTENLKNKQEFYEFITSIKKQISINKKNWLISDCYIKKSLGKDDRNFIIEFFESIQENNQVKFNYSKNSLSFSIELNKLYSSGEVIGMNFGYIKDLNEQIKRSLKKKIKQLSSDKPNIVAITQWGCGLPVNKKTINEINIELDSKISGVLIAHANSFPLVEYYPRQGLSFNNYLNEGGALKPWRQEDIDYTLLINLDASNPIPECFIVGLENAFNLTQLNHHLGDKSLD